MTSLNVVFCHGIGNHKASYATETIRALKDELDADLVDDITWASVHWGKILDSRENLITNRAIAGGDLDWKSLRRELIIGGLGDACAYLGHPQEGSGYYYEILDRVEATFSKLPDAPTVVLCHSMGCAVMMDYLFDFPRPEVQCAVLFGCNLPLFWMAQRSGNLRLPDIDRVYNLYDSDDLLAYPLKQISEQTKRWVTGDYRISTGTMLGAHTGYWTDSDFVSWVAKCLTREHRIACM